MWLEADDYATDVVHLLRPDDFGRLPIARHLFTTLQTLFYATSTASNRGTCASNAICLNGNGGNMTGDIFAPKPDVFPPTPTPTQTGATVFVAGGALSAGKGFIESWQLTIQGNTGSYTGNGVPIVIPGATHTTTDPSTTIFGQTHPGTTDPGSTQTQTVGTTIGLDQ